MTRPKPKVPFQDLGRSTARYQDAIRAALERVTASGWYVLGGELRRFEEELGHMLGVQVVGVGSGTDAIEVALRALGIGEGDEVVTQANTCVPTVAAIARSGATPVLCDVDPESALMDLESLRGAVSPRTRAIVPVHLYGQCTDVPALAAAAPGIPIVEDCAQALGAELDGVPAGTLGTAGCFSFYPTKNLGALGDAGAVATSDDELAERVRMIRQYGQRERFVHELAGVNSRLDEMQAAILSAKLPGLAQDNARRRAIGARYRDAFSEVPGIKLLTELDRRVHAYHLFVIRADDRDRVRAALEERGVATLVHYPRPVHWHPAYEGIARPSASLPGAELLCNEVLSLPLYPELEEEEIALVIDAVLDASDSGWVS